MAERIDVERVSGRWRIQIDGDRVRFFPPGVWRAEDAIDGGTEGAAILGAIDAALDAVDESFADRFEESSSSEGSER